MKTARTCQAGCTTTEGSSNSCEPIAGQSGEAKKPVTKSKAGTIRPVKVGNVQIAIWKTTNREKPIFKAKYILNGKVRQPSSRVEEELRQVVEADAIAISNGQTFAMELTQDQRVEYVEATKVLASTGISVADACRDSARAFEILNGPGAIKTTDGSAQSPVISVLDACREFAEARRIIGGRSVVAAAMYWEERVPSEMECITLRDAQAKVIEAKEKINRTDSTIRGLRNNLTPFKPLFDKHVTAITKGEIELCRDQMRTGPRAKNNAVETLVTIYNWCRANDYYPRSEKLPTAGIEPVAERRGKPSIYKPAEAIKVLENLNWTLLPDAVMQGWLGARPKEAKRAVFSDFNFLKEELTIPEINSKSGPTRTVRFTPAASSLLAPYHRCIGPACIYAQTDKLVSDAATRAGVKYLQDGFRHSYATYQLLILTAIGVADPWGTLAKEMNTSIPKLKRNYINNEATLDEAILWFSITISGLQPISIFRERKLKGQRIKTALRLAREKFTRMYGRRDHGRIEKALQEIEPKLRAELENAQGPDLVSIQFETTEDLLEMEPLKMAREIRDRSKEIYARNRDRVTRKHLSNMI